MESLKAKDTWVLWQKEVVGDRSTKVPYSTDGMKCGTNLKYKDKWKNYETVLAAYNDGDYSGIGFVIPKGLVMIDIDGMEANNPFVREIMDFLASYAEVSPSGKGVHILAYVDVDKLPQLKGKLDPIYYTKNPHNSMEVYFGGLTNRYGTYTGECVNNMPIEDISDRVIDFLDIYMKRDNFKAKFDNNDFADFDIIATARGAKNKEKFISLFDEGDISAYASHSEADQALCNILAFYTGGDKEKIDSLFRSSKLYRDKWDRDDYRESTIDNAIKGCNGNFYLSGENLPPYLYFNPNTNKLKVNCPALADYIKSHLDYITVRDSDKSYSFRYLYEDGCYRLYPDDYFKGLIREYITQYDKNILTMRDVNEVFNILTTDLEFISPSALNADERHVNFKNGILRLSDMKLLPHSTDVLSTIQLPSNWLEGPVYTPVFDSFMDTLTRGDKAVQKLLLEFMGATLSNVKGHRMKKALFMVGPGDTGKSQIRRLTEILLGDGNYVGIDLSQMEAKFGTSNLFLKRLAGSADMSYLSLQEIKVLKMATGGDTMFCELKGKDGFSFVFQGLLWFCMNRLPKFGGDNGAWVYDRLIIVKCDNVIPKEKQDKTLLDKLLLEREGIINKCMYALKGVIDNGYVFSEPDSVIQNREEYRGHNSTVISFYLECTEKRPGGKIIDGCTTGKVYDVYRAWCVNNNHGYAKTAREFRDELSEHLGFPYADLVTRRGQGGSYFRSFTLTDDAKETYKGAYGYDETEFLSNVK